MKQMNIKMVVIMAVALMYQLSAQAQDESPALGTYKIGAKMGINLNSFTQPGTTMGGNVGGFFRYNLFDYMQLQGELAYSITGGGRQDFTRPYNGPDTFDGPISSASYINRSILVHSIAVPILARFTLPELSNGAMVPRFVAGFSYAYNFAAFEQRDVMYAFANTNEFFISNSEENVSADYFNHNFSLLGGFAIDYKLANGQVFTTEFRYQRGLTNLNAVNPAGLPITTDKLYSQVFSINVAYSIF